MQIPYTILVLVVALLYAITKQFLPDFPISEEVFQILIGYLLVKLGLPVVDKATPTVRSFFPVKPKSKRLK